MTANLTRESAQIFQFPVGGRAGLKRDLPNVAGAPRIADIAVGGSWYHEEAIRDDKPTRTN
jgi:Protein of unknown function (DUF2735)